MKLYNSTAMLKTRTVSIQIVAPNGVQALASFYRYLPEAHGVTWSIES